MSDRRALAAALGLAALALAGCEGGAETVEFSGIEVSDSYDRTVFRPGGMAVELHNAPLPGMSRDEAMALVALPDGLGEDLDMPRVEPGGWARSEHGRLIRLALRFNPEDQAGGDALCAAEAPLPAGEAGQREYSAQMALCFRGAALAEGRMTAGRGEPLDRDFVRRTLAQLFSEVLGGDSGT